jgi:hypothetical protein
MPASGVQGFKQTKGYFVAVGALPSTQQFIWTTRGTGSGGSYLPGSMTPGGNTPAPSTGVIAAGSLLKDMGKTVVSSTHTYRKVQRVITNGPSLTATVACDGAPFYIELDTYQSQQNGGTAVLGQGAATVAYLPGLM